MNLWNKMKWLIEAIGKRKRNEYPLSAKGAALILAAIGSAVGGVTFNLVIGFLNINQTGSGHIQTGEATLTSAVLSVVAAVTGSFMIWFELRKNARTTSRAFISGLPGQSQEFPEGLLSSTEQRFAREHVRLGIDEKSALLTDQVAYYNAEIKVDIFNRFVTHLSCSKLYIGGLARIPFLVAYGAMLRNLNAEIKYFDKFHKDGNYHLLDQEDTEVDFSQAEQGIVPSSDGDIGIAVGFSSQITKAQLPEKLQEHTIILEPNIPCAHNLVQNQENLERVSAKIKSLINSLGVDYPNMKRLHLFLSTQPTVALDLGRQYQEGIHRNWVIYNFNGNAGTYDWSIELTGEGLSVIDSNP